jgi:arabinofuranan 3-O-arabinosyltransferase
VARSSARLPGNLQARASSAFDGDPATAWTPPFAGPRLRWFEAKLPAPVTFDHLDLVVVADKRHSLPTRLRIETESGVRRITVPPIESRSREGATVTVPLQLRRPLTGQTVRVVLEKVKARTSRNYFTGATEPLPVGIAEAGIPGVQVSPTPPAFDSDCRDDLVTVDGRKVAVRVTGDARGAEARGSLAVDLCGVDAGGLTLGPGEHVLRTTSGGRTGIDLDRLVLSSAPGGRSLPAPAPGEVAPPAQPTRPAPAVTVERDGRTTKRVRASAPTEPFWLVLGQSHSLGWEATANGRSLGPPTVIDGYANGWLVPPDPRGGDVEVDLAWTPQRRVWVMLPVSVLGLLLCAALALRNPGRRRAIAGAPQPRLASPWRHRGSRPRPVTTAVVAVGVAAVTALVAGLPTGVLVGGLTTVTLLVPRARALVTLGAVGALAAAGLHTAALQYIADYPSVFEWPTFFRVSHNLAWVGAALLAADVVVGLVRERGAPPRPDGEHGTVA